MAQPDGVQRVQRDGGSPRALIQGVVGRRGAAVIALRAQGVGYLGRSSKRRVAPIGAAGRREGTLQVAEREIRVPHQLAGVCQHRLEVELLPRAARGSVTTSLSPHAVVHQHVPAGYQGEVAWLVLPSGTVGQVRRASSQGGAGAGPGAPPRRRW